MVWFVKHDKTVGNAVTITGDTLKFKFAVLPLDISASNSQRKALAFALLNLKCRTTGKVPRIC